ASVGDRSEGAFEDQPGGATAQATGRSQRNTVYALEQAPQFDRAPSPRFRASNPRIGDPRGHVKAPEKSLLLVGLQLSSS
ncbi:MAG: hypothetical protein AAF658_12510, partial [Myxococcota bacterium]